MDAGVAGDHRQRDPRRAQSHPLWRRYASDVAGARPTPLWQLPSLTDGANGQHDAIRISTHGRLSPQNLAGIVISKGFATKTQMNNLLRATFMEELN